MLLYIEACKSGSMFDGIIGDNKNGKYKFGINEEFEKFHFEFNITYHIILEAVYEMSPEKTILNELSHGIFLRHMTRAYDI